MKDHQKFIIPSIKQLRITLLTVREFMGAFSKEKIKRLLGGLLKLNNTPPEIALGVSIGVMIAVMPLYGLHTILCVIFALLIPRANKIAILVGTNISLPPTVPFITWAGYNLGRLILVDEYPPLTLSSFQGITFKKMLDFYYPLLVGSFILGIMLAIIFYFMTLWFMEKRRSKKGHDRDQLQDIR